MLRKTFIPLYVIILLGSIYIFFYRNSGTTPEWTDFNETVFIKAKREHKLVLLHLGANWCHWCHVMEETTYEDPRVVDYLNKNFIVCKEDHDKRQDLTSLYSEYGWPATIIFDSNGNELLKQAGFIDPDRFIALLTQLKENPLPLPSNNLSINYKSTATDSAKQKALDQIHEKLISALDIKNGGFNFGQKYIDFETFEYAFNHNTIDTSMNAWLHNSIVNSTDIYDNIWGGVFQYSTHNDWEHVHYEKLLSVQARYIKMYCWFYKRFNDAEALKKAIGIAAYVNRFLSDPNGGFYNAQDADLIPGQKATEYFAMNDAERISEGIPAIDKNIYTSQNAEMAEAFIILWATTGDATYLKKATTCIDLLMHTHKKYNAYIHGEAYTSTTSLEDNIAMLKTLMLLYRATQAAPYKSEATMLVREIASTFNSGRGFFYTYIGSSPIKPSYNISENIETCRLLNYSSYFFNEPKYKKLSEGLLSFLTNDAVISSLTIEPGILTASEELNSEPNMAALIIKNGTALKSDYLQTSLSFPEFYFNSVIYTEKNIPADKLNLFDAYDKNFILLCTSSYCSSPLFTKASFADFLYKHTLNNQ
jgi:uncharacterized protein YyaL (SSP411 family)